MADTILGTSDNKDVTIKQHDRLRGSLVAGSTGSGKSVLFQNAILQDIRQGLGVGLFDPTGDLIDKVISGLPENRIKDVILLDPLDTDYPFPLNLFACPDPKRPEVFEQTVENVMDVFAKKWGMSEETPRLRQYVRNITIALVGTPYTMVEIPHLLTDRAFRTKALSHPSVFWKSYDRLSETEQYNRSESTLDRVDDVVSSQIVSYIIGQTGCLDFRHIIDTNKILLVRLYADREQLTSLLGSIIIGRLLLAALSRYDIPENKRRQFNLYADEFSYFATPAMGILLTQARKYRIATTVATQALTQMSETIQATVLQAGSKAVFNVNPEDAKVLSGVFDTTPEGIHAVMPRDVFRFMSHHKNEEVKWFWSTYIRIWQRAAQERIDDRIELEYDKDILGRPMEFEKHVYTNPTATLDPIHGKSMEYYPDELQRTLDLLEEFLYKAMKKLPTLYVEIIKHPELEEKYPGEIYEEEWDCISFQFPKFRELITHIAPYLDFQNYIEKVYDVLDWINNRLSTGEQPPTPEEANDFVVNKYPQARLNRHVLERQRYLYFIDSFVQCIKAINADPIYVNPPTQEQGSKTFSDRRDAISNTLTHLDVGEAMVKTPDGEWLIKTKKGDAIDAAELDRKKAIIIQNTREQYSTPREKVEQEIASRIKPDAPPATQRKHTLS